MFRRLFIRESRSSRSENALFQLPIYRGGESRLSSGSYDAVLASLANKQHLAHFLTEADRGKQESLGNWLDAAMQGQFGAPYDGINRIAWGAAQNIYDHMTGPEGSEREAAARLLLKLGVGAIRTSSPLTQLVDSRLCSRKIRMYGAQLIGDTAAEITAITNSAVKASIHDIGTRIMENQRTADRWLDTREDLKTALAGYAAVRDKVRISAEELDRLRSERKNGATGI